VTRLEKNR